MMKLRLRKPIRRDWRNHPAAKGLLLDADLSIRGSGLKAKLLVFRTRRELRGFWKHISDFDLGRTCMGAVTALSTEVTIFGGKRKPSRTHIEADPRYFCVIGLVKGFLSMEIICHESIHAGFAFAKRVKRSPWDAQAKDFDEEGICYPSGNIAAEINRALHKADLYDDSES